MKQLLRFFYPKLNFIEHLNSAEYKKIDKILDRLSIIWGELNMLKRDTYRNPMRCDEDYETMDQLIA